MTRKTIVALIGIAVLIVACTLAQDAPVQPTPKPLSSFLLKPSDAWLDQYKQESYKDLQTVFNLAVLLDAVKQQQVRIVALEEKVKAMEAQPQDDVPLAVTHPASGDVQAQPTEQ